MGIVPGFKSHTARFEAGERTSAQIHFDTSHLTYPCRSYFYAEVTRAEHRWPLITSVGINIDVGDGWWRQIIVGDTVKMLVTKLDMKNYQCKLYYIMILSSTSEICYHHKVTNITVTHVFFFGDFLSSKYRIYSIARLTFRVWIADWSLLISVLQQEIQNLILSQKTEIEEKSSIAAEQVSTTWPTGGLWSTLFILT